MDKTIVKAFDLLEILAHSDEPLGITALSEESELGKSNVHRILQTLAGLGYVQQHEDSRYSPTIRLWEVGSRYVSNLTVREVAKPMMRQLADLTKETVHLSQLIGGEVLYIDKIESSEPVRAYTQLGGRAPAYCTATGKAMLSYADEQEIRRVLEVAEAHASETIVEVDRFMLEAQAVRSRRFAVNRGEWRADVIGLGAPIADQNGEVVAAIGLSAPASRLDLLELETLAPQLIEYAHQVSRALGCSAESWKTLAGDEETPSVEVVG